MTAAADILREVGMVALLEHGGRSHPTAGEALIFEHRLRENIAAARRGGATRATARTRAQVVVQLNRLAFLLQRPLHPDPPFFLPHRPPSRQ